MEIIFWKEEEVKDATQAYCAYFWPHDLSTLGYLSNSSNENIFDGNDLLIMQTVFLIHFFFLSVFTFFLK